VVRSRMLRLGPRDLSTGVANTRTGSVPQRPSAPDHAATNPPPLERDILTPPTQTLPKPVWGTSAHRPGSRTSRFGQTRLPKPVWGTSAHGPGSRASRFGGQDSLNRFGESWHGVYGVSPVHYLLVRAHSPW
jgi:hypothetical protein